MKYILIVSFLFTFAAYAKDANQYWVEQLQHHDSEKRINALSTISNKGIKATERAVPHLTPLLYDSDIRVRIAAINALGSINRSAKKATPELIAMLKDNNRIIREKAAEALKRIGSKKGLEAVKHYQRSGFSPSTSTTKSVSLHKPFKKGTITPPQSWQQRGTTITRIKKTPATTIATAKKKDTKSKVTKPYRETYRDRYLARLEERKKLEYTPPTIAENRKMLDEYFAEQQKKYASDTGEAPQ